MTRWILILLCLVPMNACKADTCRQMEACCKASENIEGVEKQCKFAIDRSLSPKTCHSVLETLRYLHKDKGHIPEACL